MREAVGDADGILEVVGVEGDCAEIVIWNHDGSQAEMSGNGTRIAARWLADRTGLAAVRIRVCDRFVAARALADGQIEQDLGSYEVGEKEVVARTRTCFSMSRARWPMSGEKLPA